MSGGVVGAAGLGIGVTQLARSVLSPSAVEPTSARVAAVEGNRARSGRTVRHTLTAAEQSLDLGGRQVKTWGFGTSSWSDPLRVTAGDELQVALVNELPESTTVHWHGLSLRNDMDGVPDLTMAPVGVGGRFDYKFVVPDPGTYWFHPHVGVQADTALYEPLIVDDPQEQGAYDDEAVLIIDDWTDGWSAAPPAILASAQRDGMADMAGMPGIGDMGMPTAQAPLGTDTGDVTYPAHLINGKVPTAPHVIVGRTGQLLRLRVINAASDTGYRFAVSGCAMTVTHADGNAVRPIKVDTIILGMGERYDVIIQVGDRSSRIVAVPEGKDDPTASAVLRVGRTAPPPVTYRPTELNSRRLDYTQLLAAPSRQLSPKVPDRQIEMALSMADGGRRWLINGQSYDDHDPLTVTEGERVRITMKNDSMMFHPMHLHGHAFALTNTAGTGARKDTVNVLPMQTVSIDLDADNPGQWLAHCHNTYHGELGMMTTMSYVQ